MIFRNTARVIAGAVIVAGAAGVGAMVTSPANAAQTRMLLQCGGGVRPTVSPALVAPGSSDVVHVDAC